MTHRFVSHRIKLIGALLATVVIAVSLALTLGLRSAHALVRPDYPQFQTGTVHSYTTGGNANVTTSDGGYNWCYNGNCNGRGNPLSQSGQVHSITTGLYAAVKTGNGGYDWQYNG